MTVTIESKTYLPEEDVAGRFAELVTELEASSGVTPRLTINGETIDLPPAVAEALLQVVDAMRRGLAVTVAPQDQRLTTQEAADMLGISRPTLVRMLEAGEIPLRRSDGIVACSSLTCWSSVSASVGRRMRPCRTWWPTLRRWGAYDDDPAEVRQVLKDLRSQD